MISEEERLKKLTENKKDKSFLDIADKAYRDIIRDKDLLDLLKNFGINNEADIKKFIGTISQYKYDKDECLKCPGYDKCSKAHEHYRFKLIFDGKYISNTLVSCELGVTDLIKDEKYLFRDFIDEWRELKITDLDVKKNRYSLYKKYNSNLNGLKNWIYITGNHRSGKSFIACAFLNNYMNNNNVKGAFINFPLRARNLLDLYFKDKDEFNKQIAELSNVPILVIDDFGKEYKNEIVRDNITLPIIDERARRGLFTIFTSAFDFKEIANLYSFGNLSRAMSQQIYNLLLDFAEKEYDISSADVY